MIKKTSERKHNSYNFNAKCKVHFVLLKKFIHTLVSIEKYDGTTKIVLKVSESTI